MAPSPRDRSAPKFAAVVRVLHDRWVSYPKPLISPKKRGEMKAVQSELPGRFKDENGLAGSTVFMVP